MQPVKELQYTLGPNTATQATCNETILFQLPTDHQMPNDIKRLIYLCVFKIMHYKYRSNKTTNIRYKTSIKVWIRFSIQAGKKEKYCLITLKTDV